MARLQAIEGWKAVSGRPQFDLIWISEGMEEVGSSGLREAIADHRELLTADACLWESYYARSTAAPRRSASGLAEY